MHVRETYGSCYLKLEGISYGFECFRTYQEFGAVYNKTQSETRLR
jgi:hypothetical protein